MHTNSYRLPRGTVRVRLLQHLKTDEGFGASPSELERRIAYKRRLSCDFYFLSSPFGTLQHDLVHF